MSVTAALWNGREPNVTMSTSLDSTSARGGSHEARVVIVGAGFGGLNAAKALAGEPVSVSLVDRNNYHLFQPLLYQVATGTLSPANIAQPIRSVLRRARNVAVLMDSIERVDFAAKRVIGRDHASEYNFLILATGARHSYFGNPDWEPLAPGLKDLPDALELRKRILGAFEDAEKMSADSPKRAAALTFVIVGAGPTGLEMAGAIAEIARHTLKNDFRRITPGDARIVLIDSGPRVLPTFSDDLSRKAKEQIAAMGVEVRLNTMVRGVTEAGVRVGDEWLASHTVVWAAGNEASPLGRSSGLAVDRVGRVIVQPDLTLAGHPEVQVLGDLAYFAQDGKPLPGVAPVAIQQGRHAAANILRMIEGKSPLPFRYHDKGTMATIGRRAGVADLGFARFAGVLAWAAWLLVHLIFLIGFRNRLIVFFQWVWAYFTFARDARLITGNTPDRREHFLQEASLTAAARRP